jgi:hypothetical protein
MSNPRAVRYRRLALAEQEREKAELLYRIAEEADKGVLVTADWMTPSRYMREPERENGIGLQKPALMPTPKHP